MGRMAESDDPKRQAARAGERVRYWTARRDDAIRRAVAAGASHRAVAEAVGLSHTAVAQIVRRR